jgi:hypothetical protein
MSNASEHSLVEDLQSSIDERGLQISDILAQARQLTTVSGLAFGFLLSITSSHVFERELGRVLVSFALMSTASAIVVFLLPLLYTQLRFPMDRTQILKFYVWSHKFILCGVALLFAGIYTAVWYALYLQLGWPAPIIATGMFLVPLIIYRLRKIGDPTGLT